MRKALFIHLVFACALAGALHAETHKPLTQSGASNLSFAFVGLGSMGTYAYFTPSTYGTQTIFTPATFPMYAVGYRLFIADGLAIRPALGLALRTGTSPGSSGNTDATLSQTVYAVSVSLEKHMPATSSISGHMGAQIGLLSASQKNTPSHAPSAKDQPTTNSGSFFSLGAYIGAEWFFHDAMSLGAQYQLGMATGSSSNTYTASDGSTTTDDGPSSLGVLTNTVNLILNVYLTR